MKILVTVPFQKEHQEELKKAAPDALFFFKDAYTIDYKRDEKLYHAFLKEADIIIGNPSIEEISSAPKLNPDPQSLDVQPRPSRHFARIPPANGSNQE